MSVRLERDGFGELEVDGDALWGAQTERARRNFQIGGAAGRMPLGLVHALAAVKAAAALTNAEIGGLDARRAGAIVDAARRVVAGEFDAHFPLPIWQTGSGTQTNMNVNEVISSVGLLALGRGLGERGELHPNDHVNRSQSSNDVVPTAMHVAVLRAVNGALLPAVDGLVAQVRAFGARHAAVVKIGRTHLQDATPLTVGQEAGGWARQLELGASAIRGALPGLYEVALGGTAVGTGLNTPDGWRAAVVAALAAETGLPLRPAEDGFAALAGHEALVGLHGGLKVLAVAALKVANDVRWLGSGPRAGLGELSLPENEPGSSIMPGKVNPTQAEALSMVVARVLGNDVTVGFAASQGNFELNVYKPVILAATLESVSLLADALASFDAHCVAGLGVNEARVAELVSRSLMLVTVLAPTLGYDVAAKAAKHAHAEGLSLREAVLALGLMDGPSFDAAVRPERMV